MSYEYRPRERTIKDKVKDLLISVGPQCWFFMPAAGLYGRRHNFDFVGVVATKAFGVETKRDDKDTPEKGQRATAVSFGLAGGTSFLVRDEKETEIFKSWVMAAIQSSSGRVADPYLYGDMEIDLTLRRAPGR